MLLKPEFAGHAAFVLVFIGPPNTKRSSARMASTCAARPALTSVHQCSCSFFRLPGCAGPTRLIDDVCRERATSPEPACRLPGASLEAERGAALCAKVRCRHGKRFRPATPGPRRPGCRIPLAACRDRCAPEETWPGAQRFQVETLRPEAGAARPGRGRQKPVAKAIRAGSQGLSGNLPHAGRRGTCCGKDGDSVLKRWPPPRPFRVMRLAAACRPLPLARCCRSGKVSVICEVASDHSADRRGCPSASLHGRFGFRPASVELPHRHPFARRRHGRGPALAARAVSGLNHPFGRFPISRCTSTNVSKGGAGRQRRRPR